MKKLIAPLALAFGAVLALVIGQRLSTDAMAVVLGVAVGVAASVPMSVLLVALLRRERGGWRAEAAPQPPPQLAQPHFIVLNPGMQQAATPWDPARAGWGVPLPPVHSQGEMQDGGLRRLRVVGDDDGDW